MANPSKKKGTEGENEVMREARRAGLKAERTSPGKNFDVRVWTPEYMGINTLQILATRPDRGRWLATLPLEDVFEMMVEGEAMAVDAEVEVKRYARFALHSIYEGKFRG